ncbi:MAG: hypothetical protein AAFX44_04690 [Pseudomonadota bacterium]
MGGSVEYPATPDQIDRNDTHFYTTGTMNFSKADLMSAFERAAATTGGIVDYRDTNRITGTVTQGSLDRTCADEMQFVAYFDEVDDRPTARYTIAADHTSFCGSFYAKSIARDFGSKLIANFNIILTTYE